MKDRTIGGFGGKLRDARERRGISLRQIANATKISVAVLEALERNDITRLPGGIFGRAFVRSYATEVGLDPEDTIREFIAQFPQESVTVGHPTSSLEEEHETVESDRRMASAVLWLIVICVPIAAVLLYFGVSGWRSQVNSLLGNPPPASTASSDAPPSDAAGATDANGGDVTVAGAADLANAPVGLTVSLLATAPCWVSTVVDGDRTIDRQLRAGERQLVEVRRELVLTASDAAALTVTLNGADARPLGRAGEAVTTRLTLTNFKDYLASR